MTYLTAKFHLPSSNGLLLAVIKPTATKPAVRVDATMRTRLNTNSIKLGYYVKFLGCCS